MVNVDKLIIGAGVTGLSFASYLNIDDDYLILEASDSVGGYCKTNITDGYVWDYSGHFFHFKDDSIKDKLLRNISCKVYSLNKISKIYYNGLYIDFPFQSNIHQLKKSEFIECLSDIYNIKNFHLNEFDNFKQFIYKTVGKSISDKFIVPYNEKLYACDLNILDKDCMGRFFPKVNFENVMSSIGGVKYSSYNDTFIYPEFGAYEFIKSICKDVDNRKIHLSEAVLNIDFNEKIVTTNNNTYKFNKLISTIPFNNLLKISGNRNYTNLTNNKVVVFNIGFDTKSDVESHWIYFPGSECFYRVGFYDNIMNSGKMSIYVELGLKSNDEIDEHILYKNVISDLEKVGIIKSQKVIKYEMLILNPAYVYITKESNRIYKEWCDLFNKEGIYSIGRYGSWKYCSIEDNIIEAKNLSEII